MSVLAPTPQAHATRAIDLLALPFRGEEGIERNGAAFESRRAWAAARFGDVPIRPGWWKLDARSASDLAGLEVRLSSAQNPLIVFPGERSETTRIFFRGDQVVDVSLILSPWPRTIMFERLCLRRLSVQEEARLLSAGVDRLLKKDRPLAMIAHVVARVIEGDALFVRTERRTEPPTPSDLATPQVQPSSGPVRLETGEGVAALLGPDQTLDPRALRLVAEEFARAPAVKAIYADLIEGGRVVPRPAWEPELAKSFNVAETPLFLRSDPAPASRDPRAIVDELVEREGPASLARIPLPLASGPRSGSMQLTPTPAVRLSRTPRVSAIIPTKVRIDLLQKCLEGLERATAYPELEVVVVDNGSTDERLPPLLARFQTLLDLKSIRDDGSFNFPRLVNAGVKASSGEIVLLLNDDIEPIEAGWLDRMIESTLRDDVAAVGARLLYPDRSIQHAGVVLGIGGVCGHLWKGLSEEEAAQNPYVVYPGARLAVTGACLAVRRELYDMVGGLDEAAFPVAYNDIDFCLRLGARGYRNIYRGDAILLHHESQSRGRDDESSARRRRLVGETTNFFKRWRRLIENDPYGSPEFDLSTESGAINGSLMLDRS